MILQNIKPILGLIIGAILVFLFMKNCSGNKSEDIKISTPEQTVVVKLTTKTDTIFRKQYIRVHDTIRVPTLVRITDTLFVDNTKQIATIEAIKREYKDKIKVQDSVNVSYTANTTGTLDKISIAYEDDRAERTIIRTNTIETTITNNIKPSGVYVGVGANLGLNSLTPSVEYLNNKNKFGVYYNVAGSQTPLQNVGITYSRKLF